MLIGLSQQLDKLLFVEMFWKSWNYSVGEPFMAPGGEMYRLYEHFGENVLRHGSHEWLPYSKNAMRTKSPNTNFSILLNQGGGNFYFVM